MTNGINKTVVVIGGPTGPTGTIKGVNILSAFTGATGQFAQWLQATGASGPNGLLEKVYNIGPTGLTGQHKNVIISGFSGGGGGAGSVFNPADINTHITLSNANATATGKDASNGGARGTVGHQTGKWQLQYTAVDLVDTLDYVGCGSLADTLGLASGGQANQILLTQTALVYTPGTGGQSIGASLTGNTNVIDLCVDFGAALVWYRINSGNWNGSGTAHPATGAGGLALGSITAALYPYIRLTNTSARATINTTPASPEAGFTAWG
jgi:hypothetical protein